MQLLVPEILADARDCSMTILGSGLAVGLALWLFGWRGHRFWIVLATTVAFGISGLQWGPAYGTQPLLAGLLLAVAAGALALALVRVVAFGAGGVAGWALVHALLPTWDDPLVCFLVGGLIGLLLFRLWTMALTSFAGTLVLAYSGLCLADRLGKLDAVVLAGNQTTLLNWACGGLTLLGLAVQFFLDRRRPRMKADNVHEPKDSRPYKQRERGLDRYADQGEPSRRGWNWRPPFYRRAG